jgi:sugar O-acyltransferase (sialic acid O-acetyltransferase NeuD family)
MLIIGAKGFAKELFEICYDLNFKDLYFFDNISIDLENYIYDKYKLLKNYDEARDYFNNVDNRFVLGIGNPNLRQSMANIFENLGGILTSIISPQAKIGKHDIVIGSGACVLANANITSSVKIGTGLLMYTNSIITHGCVIGDFVELSPGATLLGNCKIGSYTHIGANATILPNLTIGSNCIIGAGAVVTKNVADNKVVKGNPAK